MTAPWRTPDGREWFATRRGPRVLVPRETVPWVSPKRAPELVPPRRTRVSVAARHLCTSVRAGPLGKAALWGLGWAPWEF